MNLLIEIGVEEMPAVDVSSALIQLKEKIPHILKSKSILVNNNKLSNIKIYATPRRLAILMNNVDAGGKKGKEKIRDFVKSLVKSLKFKKSMRWIPNNKFTFSRPIRWLVIMRDNKVVNMKLLGIKSSNITYGPRFKSSQALRISSALDYLKLMRKNSVIVDQSKRKQMILDQNTKLASKVRGKIFSEKELLDEVVHLVECPLCIRCEFDKKYLKIPKEVAITVMKQHQRYFPIIDKKGNLLPYFITVANHLKKNERLIRQGNEKVVEARLNDGKFFYEQDRQHKLEHFIPDLKNITFHEKLGSIYDKAERLERMAPELGKLFNLSKKDILLLKRASHLCKADLATSLVREFSSLEGVIGKIYAKEDKETNQVSDAIYEHRLPRFRGDRLPKTKIGGILSIADRIDTLSAFFALGIKPLGSQDPYALRRSAIGLIQVLLKLDYSVSLPSLLKISKMHVPVKLSDAELKNLIKFIKNRIKTDLKDKGVRDDIVKSVIEGKNSDDVVLVYKIVEELLKRLKDKNFLNYIQSVKRINNIIKGKNISGNLGKKLLREKAEKDLYSEYMKVENEVGKNMAAGKTSSVIRSCEKLTELVNLFFDDILVICEDKKLRDNRLSLLQRIHFLNQTLFDPTKLIV